MDPILEAAERKREELREELVKITTFIEMYRALATYVNADSENKLGTRGAVVPSVEPGDESEKDEIGEAKAPDDAPSKRVRVRDNPKPADVVEAAIRLIREKGKPLSRREIHQELKHRGLEVRGADPIKALGTMLWRAPDKLIQLDGWGYWVKADPYSLAGYDPVALAEARAKTLSDIAAILADIG